MNEQADFRKFESLQERLGVRFRDSALLLQALAHRSYLNEHPEFTHGHNERLEFLGDAVLELVVTEYLFGKYPRQNEGELTAYRAASVNAEALSRTAAEIGLGDHLLLSKGEARDTGRARQAILANAFEAVVGALYLDQGLAAVNDLIRRHLFPRVDEAVALSLWQDAKSLFQEKAQERRGVTPAYVVLEESGPEHDKIFRVGLYLENELVAEGVGSSKQRAEQEAARRGLVSLGWEGVNQS